MFNFDKVNQIRKPTLKVPEQHRIQVKSEKKRSVRFNFSQGLDYIKEISIDLDNISKGIDNICKKRIATKPESAQITGYNSIQIPGTSKHSRLTGPRIVKIHRGKRS